MEFKFETLYDQKAMAAMARALRKTVRKKKSRRSHFFGWFVVALALFLAFFAGDEGFVLDLRTVITFLAAGAMVVALVFEDGLNGYFAGKRALPGTNKAVSVFSEGGYSSATEIGKTEWTYDKIIALAETDEYFVFIFSSSHAQLYDKRTISGGTTEEFRAFIEEKTGKKVERV